MKRRFSKFLAALLALTMLLSLLPTAVFAAGETGNWVEVDWSDIQSSDTIAITVYGSATDKTYVMKNNGGTSTWGPAAEWDSSNTGDTSWYWNVIPSNGGYRICPAGETQSWLYCTDNNNGLRVGTEFDTVWDLDSTTGYLSCVDSGGNTRYMGIYDNNNGDTSVNPNFRTYKNTTGNTKNQTTTFYKLEGEGGAVTPDPDPQPSESPIKAEDSVVFYLPAKNQVMTATASGSNLAGQEAALENGTLTTDKTAAVFTVGTNDEGQFTFSADGKYLTSGETGNSLTMTETASEYSYWTLEEQGEGWLVKNVSAQYNGGAQYIEYFNGFTTFGYKNSTPGNYTFQFFQADEVQEPGGTTEPEGAELVETPADGDIVVIYYPTGGKVMGTESYTYNETKDELAAVDTTLSEGRLTVPEDAAEFKVHVDKDGHYTFQSDSGYLYLDGTHVRLVEEQGEYTLFDLMSAENGSYVKSTNAQFSGKPQYLEYYGGYFTCYGMGSNTDIYTFQFYKTGTFNTSAGPITHGNQVVIYNPAYNKALSATYNGFYNNGTTVTVGSDGTVSGFTASDVWTVIENSDGTWSFSYDGQNIGMNAEKTSMPLGAPNDKWELVDAGNGLYYVKNPVRNACMEYQDSYGTWSAYYKIDSGKEGMFALAFYKVTGEIPEEPSGDLPEVGAQVVLYNLSAQGVLSGSDGNETSPSINNAAATVTDGAATPANGARVFTVEKNGEYFRFKTEHDGYLCSNGTGNNAFYSKDATNDADWTLTAGKKGGWNLESRTAKFNGQHSQYLEYYGGSYKTYSMYNVTDYDIYEFFFYPVAESVTVTDGVVNIPTVNFGTLSDAYAGRAYTVTFTVDSVFGVAEGLTAKYGDTTAELTNENGTYSFTIPGTALTAEVELAITVSGADTKGVSFNGTAEITVKDEPYILEVFPAASAQTGNNKTPEIGFTFGNAGDEPTVTLKVNDQDVTPTVKDGKASYTPAEAMADGKVTVTATVARKDGKSATKTWTFTIGEAQYQLYFGQLHSHTGEYSDGAGTLQEGLDYVARLPESANVDFVAFTDHSNYFDGSGTAANPEEALYDVGQMTAESKEKWDAYKGAVAAFNASQSDVVALAGFEMTWSGGPGHINTFNTPGIVSRNNSTLNNKTDDAGMKAYYKLLSNNELADSISQFNHPGTTFGNFSDFGYYDPVIDTRMYLVEVGNGEGAIGAGGYYPSYEQYIMALDKGWHLAPTNNQDNHKGKWGNANDARDVILTDDFTEAGIYEAIRNYRVYATEDKNLEINYTLNGEMLGSTIKEAEIANIQVSVHDPDDSDSISKVEVVVNSGAVAYTWDNPTELASGELKCSIPANYSYYFIRVTQGDGDLAVTAPVWIGEVVKLGVSSVECGTSTPVTGEALTLTTTLFNSESNPATVKSITYTSGSETLGTDTKGYELPASGTLAVDWKYTPTRARVMTITVTVVLEEDGIEYTYSKDISLDILDASKLVYIGIDASHYNEYVAGNYKDSMGNFGNLAAGYSVRTVQLNTSEDLIAACENESGKYKAIILTAPSRRDGTALRDPYVCYSDAEIQALKAFNAAGGVLVLAGWSDYYESYKEFPAADHMAAQQNKVLAALGSSLRIGDDATNDDSLNGGQTQRLYFSTYNWDNFLMDGVEFDAEHPNNNLYSQLFSQYGGASIYVVDDKGNPTTTIPDTVSPVVYGHASTYSKDSDGDGLGGNGMPKYPAAEGDNRLMVLATEDLGDGKGLIIVSGAAFMSNFEVQATIGDSGAEKNYSNYNICENLVNYLNPATITPIKDVQAQKDEGIKYTIEGVVTSNASGFDKGTAFFDCIYVQDDTAGINAFPVAGSFKIGDVVRITGTTSSYQGERQLNVTSIKKIGETDPVASKSITTKEAAQSTYLGSLVKIQGVVVSFAEAEGLVQTIMVRDETGYDARVFIDGYITKDTAIENLAVGHEITVVGLASYDSSFDGPAPRIRVRDRADIVCGTEVVDIPPEYVEPENPPVNPPYTPDDDDDDDERSHSSVVISGGKTDTDIPDSDTPLSAGVFTDLDKGAWYYEAVSDVVDQGLMNGVSATSFAPGQTVSRAMLATVLYRMSGETWEGDPAGFPDVEPNTWYSAAADWANAVGVVKGYDTGLFGVNDDVTREQLVTMLYRYWLHLGGDGSAQADLTAFADGGSVSEYARPAMAWAVAQGLIQGRPGGLLAPAESTTRAELCTILVRFQALKA